MDKFDISRQKCLLCGAAELRVYHKGKSRVYLLCCECGLVFASPAHFLPAKEEKARYKLHRNFPGDKDYRKFLSRIFMPIVKLLSPESRGLDFGSGTGPTLSVMFEEAGHMMDIYDHYFAKDTFVFEKRYDFITATEVLEHLYHPGAELDRLWGCLKPGGVLGVMTKLVVSSEAFKNWHYKRDPTHVCFYSREVFKWLALRWETEAHFAAEDVVLFRKSVEFLSAGTFLLLSAGTFLLLSAGTFPS